MAAFFALPWDISLAILGDWIDFLDLVCLDSACASVFRDDFLAIIQGPLFKIRISRLQDIDDGERNTINWLNSRRVRIVAVELSLGCLKHWTKLDPHVLSAASALNIARSDETVDDYDDYDEFEGEIIDLVKFRALLKRLPSLTVFDMQNMRVADKSARFVGILASMTQLKLKKIILDSSSDTKHLNALVATFGSTLEWLDLGSRICDGHLLELISTTCSNLTYLNATLCDEDRTGPHVLAAFASDRLPLLMSLILESDMDEFSDTDVDIKDTELIHISKRHPRLEVLKLPLGKRTTLASCAEALEACPNLMHISTKGYEFQVKRGEELNWRSGAPSYVADQRYCTFHIKNGRDAMDSDMRNIVVRRPFPVSKVLCRSSNVSEASLLAISEVAGNDSIEFSLHGYNRPIDVSCIVQVLSNCPNIRIFKYGVSILSDEILRAIADHAQHVNNLDLAMGGDQLTDGGVVYLLGKIGSKLENLFLQFSFHLTGLSLSAVANHSPDLTSLNICYTGITAQDIMQILIEPDALPLLNRIEVPQKAELLELMSRSGIPEDSRWWRLLVR